MNKSDFHKSDFHKRGVVERFSQNALGYEQHARLQKLVAARLAGFFPNKQYADILEIGCGTGFLTEHLLASYRGAHFEITDLSRTMLEQCADKFPGHQKLRFSLLDGERVGQDKRYDLIATSMTVQWFAQPAQSLEQLRGLLKPGGRLLYSTIGADLFPQWRAVLRERGLPCGLVSMGELPGVMEEETHQMRFANGVQFLQNLKSTGASTPRRDYGGLTAGQLRGAIRAFETKKQAVADWHILYGRLNAI